ncbi:MAG TPA: ADP-ribose pyrophosphatase [Armatimonadetes bacterium]|jgi:ADP-ribose pyrophosphatase|nr:ADP-ribose pyrophosphatase [Armatimonadota bacterium]
MKLFEKTLSSRRVFEGRIVNLRVDTVELPNGKTSTREVIEHRGAVAVVPMVDKRRVVLVRQFRQPAGRVLLEIPAGGLEIGEAPEDCARRELVEETGYYPKKLTKMFYSYLAPGYSSEKLHTFLAEDLHTESKDGDPDEFLEIVTVDLCDAVSMIQTGEIADAKSICGILLADRIYKACP